MLAKSRNILLPLGGALLISSLTGALLYFFFKKDEEEEQELLQGRVQQWVTTEVKVPVEHVGLIIGRQGCNIKKIQELTSAKIFFNNEEVDGHRICKVRGSEENVNEAQRLIMKALQEKPTLSEIYIPISVVGMIIGRNGENIRAVSRISGAKINIDSREENHSYPEDMKNSQKITIRGSQEQIDEAVKLIQNKISEGESMKRQIKESAKHLSQRSRSRNLDDDLKSHKPPGKECLVLTTSDRFIEAFVSSVENACHFWLQVVGARSIQLDRLVTNMSEYYSSEENRTCFALDKVKKDDIIAAKYPYDECWYRGKVLEFTENSEDICNSRVTVYYVDFGDTETVPITDCCELRTDFLSLSFQAIECYLAGIDKESLQGEAATSVFEELTYATKWKPVMVKVVEYHPSGYESIPVVQIVDTSSSQTVDVAEELIKKGLASPASAGNDS